MTATHSATAILMRGSFPEQFISTDAFSSLTDTFTGAIGQELNGMKF